MKPYWKDNKNGYNAANKLTIILLIVYLVTLLWIVVFKLSVHFSYMENRIVNLIPFKESFISNGKIDFSEMILNAVIFIPLGIYTGVIFKRWTFGKSVFLFFLISLMCEGLQFILRIGAFDITDLITNSFGGIIGLMTFKAIEKVFSNNNKVHNFVNLIATIGTVLIVSLLLLLKLNMLPIKYQ